MCIVEVNSVHHTHIVLIHWKDPNIRVAEIADYDTSLPDCNQGLGQTCVS